MTLRRKTTTSDGATNRRNLDSLSTVTPPYCLIASSKHPQTININSLTVPAFFDFMFSIEIQALRNEKKSKQHERNAQFVN